MKVKEVFKMVTDPSFLVFVIVQPLLFLFGVSVFLHGIYQHFWG